MQENMDLDQFNRIMKDETRREPSFTDKQRDEYTDRFMNEKYQYSQTKNDREGKKLRAKLEQGVVDEGKKLIEKEGLRKELADILSDTSGFGHNPMEKLGKYANDMADIVSGKKEIVYKDGKPGYKMIDGWQSISQISDGIKKQRIDQASQKGIKALIDDSVRKAENIQPGENSEFNWNKEYNNIKNKIIDVGDLSSLAIDKIFGNRIFKDDLESVISNGTYEDMGLTEEQINTMDPTNDGVVSKEDAMVITQALMQDQDMLKDHLAVYYTKAMEQNWNNNLSTEIQANKKINEMKPKSLKGGTINENGVFVPNK